MFEVEHRLREAWDVVLIQIDYLQLLTSLKTYRVVLGISTFFSINWEKLLPFQECMRDLCEENCPTLFFQLIFFVLICGANFQQKRICDILTILLLLLKGFHHLLLVGDISILLGRCWLPYSPLCYLLSCKQAKLLDLWILNLHLLEDLRGDQAHLLKTR